MNPLVQRLGWMLVHSVWEDILIWCVLQIVLIALARKSPLARCLAACTALAAMAGLPWLTFDAADLMARLKDDHATRSETAASLPLPANYHVQFAQIHPAANIESTPKTFVPPRDAPSVLSRLLPILVALWIAGLVLSSGRLWLSWRNVQRLIREPFQLPAPVWRERFSQLIQLSGVDRIVRLGESAAVVAPIVAGWLKPVILLPIGVMTSLPAEQVEAILLHELAHIARGDYLINLLQSIVETVFFYHPAVWAVSRRIRLERELACDDLAVQWCACARTYAEALAGFEEFRIRSPLLAATGGGDLFARIHRILARPQAERHGPGIFAVAGFCGIGIYLASMFLAPVLAENVMTAKQRIALIQALQPPPPGPEISYSPGENVFITGTIKTEGNQPLPGSLFYEGQSNFKQSEARVTSSRLGGWSGGGLNMDDAKDHRFNASTLTGGIAVGIWAQGYAPARQTVLQAKGGDVKLDFILRRGFPASVRMTDSNGRPLKDVIVSAIYCHAGEPLELSMPPVHTDASGFANFGNVEADSNIHLIASKPGWQMADRVISHWADKTPVAWSLEPAKFTAGRVIDQITHKPISGARIILAARREEGDSRGMTYDPESGQILGYSDQSGGFELDNLAKDYSYSIYVQAAGYPTATFPIAYGDQNRICELARGFHIRGKILDPEGLLASSKLYHPIELQCMYTIQATPFSGYGQDKRQPLAKLGPEIPFSFENLPMGQISMAFAIYGLEKYRYEVNLDKDIDDYVINLSARPMGDRRDPRPLRNVNIIVKTGSGTSPTGYLDGGYETTRDGQSGVIPKIIPITSGTAVTDIPVPTRMDLRADHLIGYWFAPQSFEVPAGKGVYTCVVDATAAGVIHGKVTVSPALKERGLSLWAIAIKKPPGVAKLGGGKVALSAKNDYVTTPLPFGGTYAAVLDSAPSYFVSAPALVDAVNPVVVRDFNLGVAHDTLSGSFVDENNRPIAYQEVMLTYHPTEEDAFAINAATTGGDGTFKISNMNFSAPGNYEVQLYGDGWEKTRVRIDGQTRQPVVISIRRLTK